MRWKSYKWIAVTAALMAAVPALAQSRHRPFFQREADGGMQRPPLRQDQGLREMQRDEPRPQPGRMSPEERRQLRRDINEAGRDLYRHPPRR